MRSVVSELVRRLLHRMGVPSPGAMEDRLTALTEALSQGNQIMSELVRRLDCVEARVDEFAGIKEHSS